MNDKEQNTPSNSADQQEHAEHKTAESSVHASSPEDKHEDKHEAKREDKHEKNQSGHMLLLLLSLP